MATKKITKAKNYYFDITNKSKDTTYVFKNSKVAKNTTLNFSTNSYDNSDLVRSGNDLLIATRLGSIEDGNLKVVLTTVKDYYKYNGSNANLVTYNLATSFTVKNSKGGVITDTKTGIEVIGDNGNTRYDLSNVYYNATYYDEYDDGYYVYSPYQNNITDLGGDDRYTLSSRDLHDNESHITDYSGNDKYTVTNGAYFEGFDYGGNDLYTVNSGYFFAVDLAGNDNYNLSSAYYSRIDDFKGNDNYNLNNCNSTIIDFAGNDNYEIANSEAYINDEGGKDKYNINNSYRISVYDGYYDNLKSNNDSYTVNSTTYFESYDKDGNDTYAIASSNHFDVIDGLTTSSGKVTSGNDKYTVSYSNNGDIMDYDGKDNYTIKSSQGIEIYDGVENTTYGGNDKYTVSNSSVEICDYNGKDKYVSESNSYLEICDYNGDDNYTDTNSGYVYVYDTKGKDKYTFTGTQSFLVSDSEGDDSYNLQDASNPYSGYYGISDTKGNDKYTIKNSYQIRVFESEGNEKYTLTASVCSINDAKGNDSYTVNNSVNTEINDYGSSDDSYKVNKLTGRTLIHDNDGKDKLTIGSSAKNLIFMADFEGCNYGEGINSNSLYVIDTTTNGVLEIEDYFTRTKGTDDKYTVTGLGDGCIETIKAGKKNITAKASVNNINSIMNAVGSWIDSNAGTYGSVLGILNSGDDTLISSFINFAKTPVMPT